MAGDPPPQPSSSSPPPSSSIASAGHGSGSRAIPHEHFKREGELNTESSEYLDKVEQERSNRYWMHHINKDYGRDFPLIEYHPQVNSYKCLAEGCDYRGKLSTLQQWAKIQRLHPTCQVFQDIKEYVDSGRVGQLRIRQIYKIERKDQREPFTEPHRLMLWYGVNPSRVPGIIESGLQVCQVGGTISFADRLHQSQLSATENSKGRYLFVLAEVAPGRIYEAVDAEEEFPTPPQGYDSVKTVASRVPDWTKSRLYNGAVMPCGPTVRNMQRVSYDWMYSNYILYDANRVIVRFIVECSRS